MRRMHGKTIKNKDVHFDKRAQKYDDGFEGKASDRFYKNLLATMEVQDGDEVLDVGCGTGTILNQLSKTHYIHGHGVDVEQEMLRQAIEKLPGMDIRVGSCSSLPYENESMRNSSVIVD